MHPIFVSIPMPELLVAFFARLGLELGDPFQIHMYGALIAFGMFLAIKLITREAIRRGQDPDLLMNLLLGLVIWGVVGSRLLFVVLEWRIYIDRPAAILNIREGGMVFQGGLLCAALYAVVFIRRHKLPAWKTVDVVVLGVPFGHAFGRMGCLSAACCFGAPTQVPWSITFTDPLSAGAPLNIPLHPVQIYESVGNLLIFLFLMHVLRRKQLFDGQIVLLYFILYPVLRFTVELFRGDVMRGFFLEARLGQSLSTSQAISIVELVAGVALYAWLSRRSRRSPGSTEMGGAASVG